MIDDEFDWVDRSEYPFKSRYLETSSGVIHYIDEGAGEVILFLHGNPTWSFMYRHIIRCLRADYRCVALDYIGFGLSDKPDDVSYLPQFHAENVKLLIDLLDLRDVTLVMHDWGGPIGMSYALDYPNNVKALIVFNSFCWSVKGMKWVERFAFVMGSSFGEFMCRNFNVLPRFAIAPVFGDKTRFTPSIRQHYIKPFPTRDSRKGTWMFARAALGQKAWLDGLWSRRAVLDKTPIRTIWGLRDIALTVRERDRWKAEFPIHSSHDFPQIGHFVPEEAGSEAIEPLKAFLRDLPDN